MTRGMIFKGTPGPWYVVSHGEAGLWVYPEPTGQTGHKDETYMSVCVSSCGVANARLIASAPELLEAVKIGLEALMQYPGQEKAKNIMREAIAETNSKNVYEGALNV